jgi:hypothetical protein
MVGIQEDDKMSAVIAQYVAGAILLIALFLLLSDPNGTVAVFGALADANEGAINALQGQGAPRYGSNPVAKRTR